MDKGKKFLSCIDDFTIYSVRQDCSFGSLYLNKDDLVMLSIDRSKYDSVVVLKKYNNETRSYVSVEIQTEFPFKKYFVINKQVTDEFNDTMSEFDDIFELKNKLQKMIPITTAFSAMMIVLTVLGLILWNSDYLRELSGDSNMFAFKALSIICSIASIITALIVLYCYLKSNKLDSMYDKIYEKKLRRLLKFYDKK